MSGWNDGGRGDDTVKKAKEDLEEWEGEWRHGDRGTSRHQDMELISHTHNILLSHTDMVAQVRSYVDTMG